VEAVFVLNNCKAGIHAGAIAAVAAGPTELHSDRLFCLEGRSSEMREKRATIYKVRAAIVHVRYRDNSRPHLSDVVGMWARASCGADRMIDTICRFDHFIENSIEICIFGFLALK
jgi:hypothetical protein